jgi:hypothetical protein
MKSSQRLISGIRLSARRIPLAYFGVEVLAKMQSFNTVNRKCVSFTAVRSWYRRHVKWQGNAISPDVNSMAPADAVWFWGMRDSSHERRGVRKLARNKPGLRKPSFRVKHVRHYRKCALALKYRSLNSYSVSRVYLQVDTTRQAMELLCLAVLLQLLLVSHVQTKTQSRQPGMYCA